MWSRIIKEWRTKIYIRRPTSSPSVPLPSAGLVPAAAGTNPVLHTPVLRSATLRPTPVQSAPVGSTAPSAIQPTPVPPAPTGAAFGSFGAGVQGDPNQWCIFRGARGSRVFSAAQKRAAQDTSRKRVLEQVAARASIGWNQTESATFHRLRAFLHITSLCFDFVCSQTKLPKQTIENSLRGGVWGDRENIER